MTDVTTTTITAAPTGPAANTSGSAARRPATDFHDLDRFLRLPRLSGLALSPDGTRLVTAVATLNGKGTAYATALWGIDTRGQAAATRLTRSAEGEAGAAFTATGDLLFTSARPVPDTDGGDDHVAALWSIPAAGGEARIVHSRPGGVGPVLTAADADVTVVRANVLPGAHDEAEDADLRAARKTATVSAILHAGYPVRFWDADLGPDEPRLFALEAGAAPGAGEKPMPGTTDAAAPTELRPITVGIGNGLMHAEQVISPDGATVLAGETVALARADLRNVLIRIDVATGEWVRLVEDADWDYAPGPISPDNTRAVVVRDRRTTPERAGQLQLMLLDLRTGQTSPLAHDWDRWGHPHAWLPDGSGVVVTADQDGRSPVFVIDVATSAVRQVTTDDAAYTDLVVGRDGAAYALQASYAHPAEPVRIDLTTGEVTGLRGPVTRSGLPGRLEEVRIAASDGTPLRAWLALPDAASSSAPAPLLLWIHGGPLSSWNSWSWRWCPWLLVARGYAVLLPDPALSTGYGQDFIQRGWGAWGDKPFTDLMEMTDAVVARDDVDDDRTAAMGGSFGGYMANWVAGHTDRFDAVVTHASLWALDNFARTTDMSLYWEKELSPAMTDANSPHHAVADIHTPVLVIHGDKDYRVPINEGLRLWYELLSRSGLAADEEGRSPHRFLYFPDENHWVLKPQHAKVWYGVVGAFLAEHVLGRKESLPTELGLTRAVAEEPAAEPGEESTVEAADG
ncbi:S9 family peptidase [Tersicoccus phoenicis]|uniref:S9 family peptidase n=1 Tax=Tersicoccus phoenicis TaxID=554083 RepID=A0A1R1LD38_9MICC|nr:alpha/beta fold hydrolase [Tersicoccus phoenicis]OMH25449.1 S9 family peptidase [Tersicoccus phoenicis]